MVDARCRVCAAVREDTLQKDGGSIAPCASCGGEMERIFQMAGRKTSDVHVDSIPGGLYIKHGLCNEDGTPRRYDSYSEIRREEERRGLIPYVTHEVDPASGSDKNPYTQRFIGLPAALNPEDEARRIAAWHEHEKAEGFAPPKPAEKPRGISMGANRDPKGATKEIIKAHI
jgi:hypothetical protein